jgi:hypothetical protein
VVWVADNVSGDEFEIFGQQLSGAGAEVGSDFRISQTGRSGDPARDAGDSEVAPNSQAREYITLWQADALATDDEVEIFGRLADPRPRCKGKPATVVAADTRQATRGTPGRDVIVGTARSDTIRSAGGNDLMCAGSGNDLVHAGGGNDRVFGEGGNDRLFGGTGNDLLDGGPGRDRIAGGAGRDQERQ